MFEEHVEGVEIEESVSGVDGGAPDADNPGDEAVQSIGANGVPPGPFQIQGTVKRNMRAQCLVIPKQQGALIDIESIEIGDEDFVLGAQVTASAGGTPTPSNTNVPGTDFAEYGQCSNVVANTCITSGTPVTISGVVKSLTATDIQATFRGTKLPKNVCPPK